MMESGLFSFEAVSLVHWHHSLLNWSNQAPITVDEAEGGVRGPGASTYIINRLEYAVKV
jgi:hypothetical protein